MKHKDINIGMRVSYSGDPKDAGTVTAKANPKSDMSGLWYVRWDDGDNGWQSPADLEPVTTTDQGEMRNDRDI